MTSTDRLIIGMGYLGRRVAKLWLEEGLEVHATTRKRARFAELSGLGVRPVAWDVLTGGEALPRAEVVLWGVGYDRSSSASQEEVYGEGLARTLGQLPRPGRLIYVSSTGVYGDSAGEWVDENTPAAPVDAGGKASLLGERILWEFAVREGWDVVVLRFAGIYGPGRMMNAEKLRLGEAIAGDGEGWLNLIHVEDGARVVREACAKGKGGETYLVSDGTPTLRVDFYRYLAELVGGPGVRFDGRTPARHRGSRRVNNEKMRAELGPTLVYPSYREGLVQSLANW